MEEQIITLEKLTLYSITVMVLLSPGISQRIKTNPDPPRTRF